jgi:hypothetical protein
MDGKDIPIEMGEPKSLIGFSLNFTCVAGCDEALSTGILTWGVEQPKARNRRKTKSNKILLETILITSF